MKVLLRIILVVAIGAVGIFTVQAVMDSRDTQAEAGAGGSDGSAGGGSEGSGANAGDVAADEGDVAADAGVVGSDEPAEAGDAVEPEGNEPASAAPAGDVPALPADPVSAEAKAAILLVNKQHPLESDYKPTDLVVPDVKFSFSGEDQKKQLRREAAEAIERLFAAAKKDGIELRAVSGYRSYARQKSIFENNARTKGEEEANRTSARPGESEHQTGLAMDVSAASVNYALEEVFGETVEGIWLAEHAQEYGFIIRYPKEKEDITGYKYEPWHLRYVGEDIAQFVTEQGLTLEEYLLDDNSPQTAGSP